MSGVVFFFLDWLVVAVFVRFPAAASRQPVQQRGATLPSVGHFHHHEQQQQQRAAATTNKNSGGLS
jgi:hypothetical protein